MAGLVQVGRSYQEQGNRALANVAERGMQRESANQANEDAEKAGTVGAVATGAGIGTSIMPGWGTAIGAGVGLLSSLLF